MNITETRNEGLERDYEIVLTDAELNEKMTARLGELSQTVNIPGFRPGKVPAAVVKARFGDQVKGEVIRTALDDAAKDAIETNELKLASQPKLDIETFEDGEDLVAKLMCEVMPEITVPDLAGLEVERPTLPVAQTEIDATLDRLAQENRPTAKVEKKRKAKLGDVVLIDFTGRIDGEAFEGGSATDHMLELGSNSFIPGFEEGLVGAEAGTTVDVKVSFPEDYQAAHLAGKEAVFECPVKELHERGEASVDDELATKLGFEDLAGLTSAVEGQLGQQHAQALRAAVKTNILDGLAETVDFDVPPSLYQSEYDAVIRAMKPELAQQQAEGENAGLSDETLSEDEKSEAQAIAMRRVRLGLLVTEIGQQANVEVTEEDARIAVFEQARRFPGQEQQVLEYYQKNPDAMRELAGPLFEEKVMDYILEIAKVTDVETTAEALYGEAETTEKPAAKAKKAAKKASAKKAATKEAAAKKPAAKKKAAKKKAAKKS